LKVDLLLENCRLVTFEGEILEACIAVEQGKIAALSKLGERFQADRRLNVEGKLVLPGVIDCHVHFRDPGKTFKEDFATGSAAAAVGGVTTVFDMPNTNPPTTSLPALKAKMGAAREKSLVDYAFWGGLSEDNLEEAERLAEGGVIGFKVSASRRELEEEAGVFTVPRRTETILALMEAAGRLPLGFHCEDYGFRVFLKGKFEGKGLDALQVYHRLIPGEAEASAAGRVLAAASLTGHPIHLVHVSSRATLGVVHWWRSLGVKVTVETCPHYLLLTREHVEKLGGEAKINPPLKGKEDLEALWEALNRGEVDVVASDHSPHTPEEKADFAQAPPGFCGVETLLPLLLTQALEGRLPLRRLVEVLCWKPAEAFGLWRVKGSLQPGFDADLVVVDTGREWTIRREKLHSKSKVTPWDGWKVKGFPVLTMVRGETVAENGEPVGKPGWGRMVKPWRSR